MHSPLPTVETPYVCPGETHAISRAVHLSRLAACYPKCRECPRRHETGQLPQPQFSADSAGSANVSQRSLFTLEGVRGVYLNELTRHKAGEFAAAFARLLWGAFPLTGRSDSGHTASKRPMRRNGPVVVVGFDERPSSPDIVTGVAAALRRMSCQVVDIGQVSGPCFRFAVAHLHAAGGILVSGHGCDSSWTGLDFVGKQGRPISAASRRVSNAELSNSARPLSLDDLQACCESGFARPLREGGTQRVFQASVPYLAGLWKHFHALRPLRVAIGCSVGCVRTTLNALFEQLPVSLAWVELPQRVRKLLDGSDPDVQRVRAAVIDQSADFGFVIDDDGASIVAIDDQGELVSPEDLLCLLAEVVPTDRTDGAVVVANTARDTMPPRLAARNLRCWLGGWTLSEMWQALRHEAAICGGDHSGRVWFRDVVPTTDAILTLAHLLQALSRSDAPLSEVLTSVRVAA